MASFLENLINNAAKSVNEGIKNRIEDGTFNRMAEGVGSGVSSMATGLSALVGMANQAFGKLKEKVDEARESKAAAYDEASERYEAPAEPQQAFDEGPDTRDFEPDSDYEPGVQPMDDFLARLAKYYELDDEDLILFGMARLNVLTALFFARCDGQYTKREHDSIQNFQNMILDNVEGVERDALYHIFDELGEPTIDDVIAKTHRLLGSLKPEEHESVLSGIDHLIREVIESEPRDTTVEEDYYDRWRQEFLG